MYYQLLNYKIDTTDHSNVYLDIYNYIKIGSNHQHIYRKQIWSIQIVIPLVHNCDIGKDRHPVAGGSVGLVDVAEEMQTGAYHSHSLEQPP